MKPQTESAIFLLVLIVQRFLFSQAHECPQPPTPSPVALQGPWIGDLDDAVNPLITTNQKGILVSQLSVYQDEEIYYVADIVIDTQTGSVRRKSANDNFKLTPLPNENDTADLTAGYSMAVEVATDGRTAEVQLVSPNDEFYQFTIQAPESGFEPEEYAILYHLLVSPRLSTAYFIYKPEEWTRAAPYYTVLDLSSAAADIGSATPLQTQEFPYPLETDWNLKYFDPRRRYEDLQLFAMINGDPCAGEIYVHYNKTHLSASQQFGDSTHYNEAEKHARAAVRSGDNVASQGPSYFWLDVQTAEMDVDATTSDQEDRPLMAVDFTVWETTIPTGESRLVVQLNMEDVQGIADELTGSTTDRTFLNNPGMPPIKDKEDKNPLQHITTLHEVTSIHILSSLKYDLKSQGQQHEEPDSDDLRSLVAATTAFFREAFQKRGVEFLYLNLSSVHPRQDKPDQFTLEFVANIIQEGDNPLSMKEAANIMAEADFRHYIVRYLGPSQSVFQSTVKVMFRGIAE